jgi:hypothetical protein
MFQTTKLTGSPLTTDGPIKLVCTHYSMCSVYPSYIVSDSINSELQCPKANRKLCFGIRIRECSKAYDGECHSSPYSEPGRFRVERLGD